MSQLTPGSRFRALIAERAPVQIVGTVNAFCALLAQKAGHQAIYLSGAGVANASLGLPDLGISQLADVAEDARRITAVCDLPLLVDVDTGWGSAFNIARTVREMERAGVAAIHMEDQVQAKRCGHRPNKALVSPQEMVDRVRSAVDARRDEILGMARRVGAELAEPLDLLDRHGRRTEEVEHRVQEHRAVPGRQHEAVAVGPGRLGRIEADETGKQKEAGHALK